MNKIKILKYLCMWWIHEVLLTKNINYYDVLKSAKHYLVIFL